MILLSCQHWSPAAIAELRPLDRAPLGRVAPGYRLPADTAARAASFGALNMWYYADAPASVRPRLEAARRITAFDEVTGGLDESTALFEARRCMSCGNCFGCDNCHGVCPDNAII
jgi:ferredoxin